MTGCRRVGFGVRRGLRGSESWLGMRPNGEGQKSEEIVVERNQSCLPGVRERIRDD